MPYELFKQGPAAYIPVILISLIVTLAAYGAFPLIYARTRKKIITKRKYNVLCYCFNFLILILFVFLNGEPSSGGPYILWTWVFSTSGIKILKKRGVLEGFKPCDKGTASSYQTSQVMEYNILLEADTKHVTYLTLEENPSVCFCRKCGFELIAGSNFCSRCGTKVAITEGEVKK